MANEKNRKKTKKTGDVSANMDIPMTPMIDVIFQLLIFFMCATKFKTLEGKMLTYLPKDVGLLNTPVANPNLDEVRIHLIWDERAPNLKTRIEVRLSAQNERTRQQFENFDDLSAYLAQQYDRFCASGIEVPFLIDPHQRVPLQAVVSALDACRRAKIKDVRFAAKSAIDKGLEWEREPHMKQLK